MTLAMGGLVGQAGTSGRRPKNAVAVDRVLLEDVDLPEPAAHRIVEAFSEMTFHPGRIGRIAVRSQIRIEIDLVSVPAF